MHPLKRALTFIAFGLMVLFFSPLGIGLVYGLQTWPLSPFLAPFLSPVTPFFQILGWAAGVFAFPIALVAAIFGKLPKRAWPLYALGCVLIWSFVLVRPLYRHFWPLRRAGLEKSIAQLAVLPPAIERFRRDKGKYPAQLDELVPHYLPQIPSTGMVAYPTLRYRRGDTQNRLSRYELQVHTSTGFINFDALYYRPDGDYEFLRKSGAIERIGAWAYLHE